MRGTIFTPLRRYVQTQYDHSAWVRRLEAAGLSATTLTSRSAVAPRGKFGEHLLPEPVPHATRLSPPGGLPVV